MKVNRARDFRWISSSHFDPGPQNAITDVPGVLVGHTTLIDGEAGPLHVGRGPVRTGVTAIRPHPGDIFIDRVAAGVYVLNGYGKTTGLEQVKELGTLETPVLLTNTLNVWRCADALVDWMLQDHPDIGVKTGTINPVVGECNDGWLNDIQGRHVTKEDVFSALATASDGPVEEGNVGAGTGTRCYQFKGGIGTSSRHVPVDKLNFTVGVLLQSNFGLKEQLMIRGQPVGKKLLGGLGDQEGGKQTKEDGSCMVIIATDFPLNPLQLTRLARRAPLGLARTGFTSNPGSGDYVIAFSTTHGRSSENMDSKELGLRMVDEVETLSFLFQAVVEATEEAVLNSLVAAETLAGRDGHVAHAIPIDIICQLIGGDE